MKKKCQRIARYCAPKTISNIKVLEKPFTQKLFFVEIEVGTSAARMAEKEGWKYDEGRVVRPKGLKSVLLRERRRKKQ